MGREPGLGTRRKILQGFSPQGCLQSGRGNKLVQRDRGGEEERAKLVLGEDWKERD
jgi:hypothetical protein